MPIIAFALLLSSAPIRSHQFALSGAPVPFVPLALLQGCRRALSKLATLSTVKRHGEDDGIEVAFADFDRDGLEDVVVRFRSRFGCGSNGCDTEIYLARPDGRFRWKVWKADASSFTDSLITDGPVAQCRGAGRPGIAFPHGGPGFACFPLR